MNSLLFILFVLLSWCLIDTTGAIQNVQEGVFVFVILYVSLHVKNVMKSVPLFATMRVAERKVGVRTLSVIEHLIFWHFSTSNSHFNFSHLRFLSFHVRSRLGTKTETAMLILRSFRPLPTHLSTRDISRSSFNQ